MSDFSVQPGGFLSPGSDAAAMMRYDANKRSAVVAYLLWFFLGGLGAHRFYLKRNGSAAALLALTIVSVLLTVVAVGLLGFIVVGICASSTRF